MNIDIVGITSLFFATVNIVLGLFVLLKGPRKSNNIVYALSVGSIAVWVILTYFYNNPVLYSPKVWLKLVYIASYGMLFSQLVFSYYFPQKIKDKFFLYIIPIFITVIPSIYVLLVKDSVIADVYNYPKLFLSIASMGSDYWVYTLPNVLGIVLIAPYFFFKTKNLSGYEKAQVRFYIIGTLLMMIPIVIIDYLIPIVTGNTKYFVLGPLFVIPFTIAAAYPILESRFVRIPIILGNITSFILKLFFIFSSLLIFLKFIEEDYYLQSNKYISTFLFALLFVLVYFYIFQKLIAYFFNRIDKLKKQRKILEKNFLQVSGVELTMGRIVINLQRTIKGIFNISNSGIFLYDKVDFSPKYNFNSEYKDLDVTDLIEIIQHWDKVQLGNMIVADEVKREGILQESEISQDVSKVLTFMDENNISVLYPFNSRTRLNGLLVLGYRNDKYPLSRDEIEILEKLINNLSISIGRAILYDEIQDFSNTLKQRVNQQTKELQQKVLELEDARRKERDMIDIMGHELRTPATIAKLNADLLKRYIDSNPANFKKYVDRIRNSIENEIRLIDTLLTSAKLEGSKIEINSERVSILEQIEGVVHQYTYESKAKDLKIIVDTDEDTPDVYADKVRVSEVLDNLISNAIKYTDEGSIIVQTKHTSDHVQVNVIDTGKGIPPDEMSKLGTKFHRVENYITGRDGFNIVRPGGTGLGLYVVYGLVAAMGGKIWVTSQLDKGTTFSFTLPVYTGQREDIVELSAKNMFEKYGLKK